MCRAARPPSGRGIARASSRFNLGTPQTPTRAPDNQFRKMKDWLKVRRQCTKVLRLGSGVPIPSVKVCLRSVGACPLEPEWLRTRNTYAQSPY